MHWRPSVRVFQLLPVAMCAISIGGCGPQAETRAGAATGATVYEGARLINKVFLRGQEVDRAGLRAKWQARWNKVSSTQ